MRIWDTFIVASEADLDLLEARFTEYADLPVTHVIAEAPAGYQGNPKPLWFVAGPENGAAYSDRFRPWHGRWNHVRVEAHELPDPKRADPKTRKDALRDKLAEATCAEPDDLVLHGGIDEIPSAATVRALLAGEAAAPVGMEMRWCVYTPGLVHPRPWRGTVAQRWRHVGSFAGMRERRFTLPAVVNAGTRLSMLGQQVPESGMHPDGHALRETEVDETWPRWVHAKTL